MASVLLLLALTSAHQPIRTRMCEPVELSRASDYRSAIQRVGENVDSASRIVRVRAIGADSARRTVTFRALERLRGTALRPDTLALPGVAVLGDDFNDGTVPYQMVRRATSRRLLCPWVRARIARRTG